MPNKEPIEIVHYLQCFLFDKALNRQHAFHVFSQCNPVLSLDRPRGMREATMQKAYRYFAQDVQAGRIDLSRLSEVVLDARYLPEDKQQRQALTQSALATRQKRQAYHHRYPRQGWKLVGVGFMGLIVGVFVGSAVVQMTAISMAGLPLIAALVGGAVLMGLGGMLAQIRYHYFEPDTVLTLHDVITWEKKLGLDDPLYSTDLRDTSTVTQAPCHEQPLESLITQKAQEGCLGHDRSNSKNDDIKLDMM